MMSLQVRRNYVSTNIHQPEALARRRISTDLLKYTKSKITATDPKVYLSQTGF